jgi:hypothetical protein
MQTRRTPPVSDSFSRVVVGGVVLTSLISGIGYNTKTLIAFGAVALVALLTYLAVTSRRTQSFLLRRMNDYVHSTRRQSSGSSRPMRIQPRKRSRRE